MERCQNGSIDSGTRINDMLNDLFLIGGILRVCFFSRMSYCKHEFIKNEYPIALLRDLEIRSRMKAFSDQTISIAFQSDQRQFEHTKSDHRPF